MSFMVRIAAYVGWPIAKACCSNPKPQIMYDTIAKKRVLQCLNCGCFVG